jgi:hypothetical protein
MGRQSKGALSVLSAGVTATGAESEDSTSSTKSRAAQKPESEMVSIKSSGRVAYG